MSKAQAATAKPATKSEIMSELAEKTGVAKKDVAAIFEKLTDLIKRDLGKKGPGVFTIPGLLKLKVKVKPATKAREGVNPFTQEKMVIKAKPASRTVKATPLKALKEMV